MKTAHMERLATDYAGTGQVQSKYSAWSKILCYMDGSENSSLCLPVWKTGKRETKQRDSAQK